MKKIAVMLLALVMAMSLIACGAKKTETCVIEDGAEVGEGAVNFVVEVVDQAQHKTTFTVHTDEKTVGAALQNLGVIAGEDSEYGLYVKTVNGITADYDADGSYWAFYIDGESATTGVDATNVTADAVYTFAVEVMN